VCILIKKRQLQRCFFSSKQCTICFLTVYCRQLCRPVQGATCPESWQEEGKAAVRGRARSVYLPADRQAGAGALYIAWTCPQGSTRWRHHVQECLIEASMDVIATCGCWGIPSNNKSSSDNRHRQPSSSRAVRVSNGGGSSVCVWRAVSDIFPDSQNDINWVRCEREASLAA